MHAKGRMRLSCTLTASVQFTDHRTCGYKCFVRGHESRAVWMNLARARIHLDEYGSLFGRDVLHGHVCKHAFEFCDEEGEFTVVVGPESPSDANQAQTDLSILTSPRRQ